jgi:nucleotide-binding universal stress UspA family protein
MTIASPTSRVAVKNILFPTDFSPQSEAAFEYAKLLARHYDATVHAVHVVTPELYGALPAEGLSAAVATLRHEVHGRMDELHRRMQGLQHATFISEGPLWEVLNIIIRKHDIDFVVLGTTARTGLERMLLGSAAEEIFRRAEVPVLTIGPHARPPQPSKEGIRRILFATDFSAASDAAAAYAVALAQEYQAHLTLLHVIEDPKGEFAADYARVVAYLGEKLRSVVPREAELWCEPEILIVCGKPADRILSTQTEQPVDLIVLGARKSEHPLAVTHFRWPTAAHVVHAANCPVLTVRG